MDEDPSANTLRQREFRARKAAASKTRLSVYLGPDGRQRLADLSEAWGCSPSQAIEKLLKDATGEG